MTTLRRDIRLAILPILQSYNTHDEEMLSDEITDAVLAIVNKPKPEVLKPVNDPMWNFLHGIEITQEEIDDNKLIQEATAAFERDMGFNPLPWSSNQAWTKFQKFSVEQYKKDSLIFSKYKTWQKNEGKYVAMSNRKIRENPQVFIDCWPDFLAHSAMYSSQPTQQSFVENDENGVPKSY